MPELNLHSDGNGFKYCVRFLFLFSTNLQEFQENLFFFFFKLIYCHYKVLCEWANIPPQ